MVNKHMKIILSEEVNKALDIMGYSQLMPIQEKVIPLLLEDRDVVVKAKTGSGKTAAFGIPLCEKIDWEVNQPQAVILACTRELAMQIQREITDIGKFKKIKVACVIGKENMDYQRDALKQKCHIVVATPGRLYDHLRQGNLDVSKVKYVVIDEADYMLDMGFVEQVEEILDELPDNRVTALFSATYPNKIQDLVSNYTNDAEMIDNIEDSTIEHEFIVAKNKWNTLLQLLNEKDVESSIIFCNLQVDVDRIADLFRDEGVYVSKIHGGMQQKDRIKNIDRFKKGDTRILVASDVVARGIDIEKVSNIFHFDMPQSSKEYIHRCGRSGRINRKGNSTLIIEKLSGKFSRIKDEFNLVEIDIENKSELDLKYLNKKVQKEDKKKKWKNDICKLFFSVGKDKKVRTIDIVGSLCSVEGLTQEDIGVISVLNKMSYVEILNGKEQLVLNAYRDKTIKNKKVKVEIADE